MRDPRGWASVWQGFRLAQVETSSAHRQVSSYDASPSTLSVRGDSECRSGLRHRGRWSLARR